VRLVDPRPLWSERATKREGNHLSGDRSGRRGFTLIELIVVIAIGAIMIGSMTVAIGNIRKADLKSATGMMAGAMRYMYNLAVINNRPYRLVIDMNESIFWGEELETDNPCARFLPEGDPVAEASDREREAEEKGKEAEDLGPVGLDPRRRAQSSSVSYKATKDNLLSRRQLPRGILVTGVMTSNHEGPREDGRVAIHFFPGGYAEQAYVWLGEEGDPDEDVEASVTLSLDSLMGRVTRHSGALSPSSFVKELQ
jgi:general secretion pathway protein H